MSEPRLRWFTAEELAERLQLSKATIYRLAADGKLGAVKSGRAVRFPPEAEQLFRELAVNGRDPGPGAGVRAGDPRRAVKEPDA